MLKGSIAKWLDGKTAAIASYMRGAEGWRVEGAVLRFRREMIAGGRE